MLNERDKKVRKNWLIATITLYSLNFLGSIGELLQKVSGLVGIAIGIVSLAIISALCFWWLYYCAYKKHGRLLLNWVLVFGSMKFFIDISEIFKKADTVPLIGTACMTAFYIWWFIASLRLRKLNIKLITVSIK